MSALHTIFHTVTNLAGPGTSRGPAHTDHQRRETQDSGAALIRTNVEWLHQVLALIRELDQTAYATTPTTLPGYKVGSHVRHIVEFYEALLEGIPRGYIDYDARQRDKALEENLFAVTARIQRIMQRLESLKETQRPMFVRMEDTPANRDPGMPEHEPWLQSSIQRELLAVSSHTVHHFALIAIIVRAHGISIHPDFGVAPATLAYRRRLAAGNTAPGADLREQA